MGTLELKQMGIGMEARLNQGWNNISSNRTVYGSVASISFNKGGAGVLWMHADHWIAVMRTAKDSRPTIFCFDRMKLWK